MTTETETNEDFAAFEARVMAGEPDPVEETTETEENHEVNDELQLSEEDELVEGDEDEGDKKPRHKSAKQRIAEQRWQIGERDRRIAELEARLSGKAPETTAAPVELVAPDPDDFEFGDADPKYLEALTDYKVDVKLAERDKKASETTKQAEQRQAITALDAQWSEKAAKGAEKYDDFDEVVTQGAAEGKWLCPPIMAAAISASDVGDDIAYHLASNPAEAAIMAAQANSGDLVSAARKFGEIEGQYLDKAPDPPKSADPLEWAVYAGQVQAFANKRPAETKPEGKKITEAPEPAKTPLRGGGGKFEVSDDTDDFKAFEAKIMKGRR